jgi:hypothetical protein
MPRASERTLPRETRRIVAISEQALRTGWGSMLENENRVVSSREAS